MTTRAAASLLRHAWLLAATLAVITGLLGMHVLTSGHGSHGSVSGGAIAGHAAVAHSAVAHSAVAHSAGDGHAVHAGHPATGPDAPVLESAACGGSCPGAQKPGAPCVPTAPGGPVSVSPPPASLTALPALAAVGNTPGYSYLPPCLTPCDLSISRT
ncbi:hypothetical protein FBY30_2056 [Arthrobacter sp. SLBN-83]|uniref:hypothetical protein n=1 Tax=Arthrobacter sp. SLBN-83 TaxID=2768449 RepID=UPI001152A9B1|nr:hypothetical protein [Arthrobacter sp. SLBN-83]TQJ59802.1 hypothetical protein FBY30_2056 [Arthrobacter sp. SLBN-83]